MDTWSNAQVFRENALRKQEENNGSYNEVSLNESLLDKLFKVLSDFIKHASAEPRRKHHTGCVIQHSSLDKAIIQSPEPQHRLTNEDLPDSWDWRSINGTNYLSWTVNQVGFGLLLKPHTIYRNDIFILIMTSTSHNTVAPVGLRVHCQLLLTGSSSLTTRSMPIWHYHLRWC